MSKAYDRVEWDYLEAMMKKMAFPEGFVALVMRCVRSVSSFLLNRSVYGHLRPTRGLRQGDPLSPFLFVICAQGVSSLLHFFQERGFISGVPIAPRAFNITHLFFADDSLLFIKANRDEAVAVMEVLRLYEAASGQLINMGKYSVSFSPNTKRREADAVKDVLGLSDDRGIHMYLGLPAFTLRQKRLQFGYLRDKIQKKLLNWNQREFSAGGKEVLLKAVVQAIPTYAMQCFRVPEAVCADIDRLCAGFWWGDKEEGKHIHWARWELLCRPKEKGGMGFRNIRSFNKALLAKQFWRLISHPDSLVAKVFKARYCTNGDFLTARIRSNASFVWRSLIWSRDIIEEGSFWKVGDGNAISVYKDKWVVGLDGPIESSGEAGHGEEMRVCELMNSERGWDVDKVRGMDAILATPIGESGSLDERIWRFDAKGRFSVKGLSSDY